MEIDKNLTTNLTNSSTQVNANQQTPLTDQNEKPKRISTNRPGIVIIAIAVVVVIIIIAIGLGAYYFGIKNKTTSNIQPSPTSTVPTTPQPTTASNSGYLFINSLEDALKNADKVTDLPLCDKKLTIIPPTIGTLTKVEFMDLSENSLTTLPSEINKLTSLKELILVDNNFSVAEQARIKQMLPNTKIAFVPQRNFNPYIADNWKTYTSSQYGFTFKYNPELTIKENNKGLSIASDLVGFERAFASCSVEKAYISLAITVEDNPNNLSPVKYLENAWKIQINQQGDKYIVDKEQAMRGMIGDIKNYKNGDLEGLIADAGESKHPRIVTSHNNKFYIFQYLPGGETGSGIPDIAKKTLDQSLATFKYTK